MRRASWFAILFLAACSGEVTSPAAPAAKPAEIAAPTGPHEVVVFATYSLRAAFTTLAELYRQDHPNARVTLRCEGGNQLLEAMNAGANCDVIAIGDNSLMAKFTAGGHLAVGSATELGRNRIAIVVAKGNPKQVKGLTDFQRTDLRIALGARSSSIGRHGRWVLSRQNIEPKPTSEADHAEGVLQKVATGEADLGIVYATSIAPGQERVESLTVPEADNTPVLYSIATAREAKQPQAAAAFRALALSGAGQKVMQGLGFLPIGFKQ